MRRAFFFVVVLDFDDSFLVEVVVDRIELVVLSILCILQRAFPVLRLIEHAALVDAAERLVVFVPAAHQRVFVRLEHLHDALVLQELVVLLLQLNHCPAYIIPQKSAPATHLIRSRDQPQPLRLASASAEAEVGAGLSQEGLGLNHLSQPMFYISKKLRYRTLDWILTRFL